LAILRKWALNGRKAGERIKLRAVWIKHKSACKQLQKPKFGENLSILLAKPLYNSLLSSAFSPLLKKGDFISF